MKKTTRITLTVALALTFSFVLISGAEALEQFSKSSIEGTYSFVALEQGDGTAQGAALPEAAMGLATFDGDGNVSGTIIWNMPDPQNPTTERFIVVRHPFTGTYNVGGTGFGSIKVTMDLTSFGLGEMTLKFHMLITEATSNKMAKEVVWIAQELVAGGGLPTVIMKLQ